MADGDSSQVKAAKIAAAAAIGAALIGLLAVLIPRIGDDDGTLTRESPGTVSATQLKTELAEQMSDAVAKTITQGQLIGRGVIPGSGQSAFNDTLESWRGASAKLEARLSAYFPSTFREQWRAYAARVEDVYSLSATGEQRKRCPWAQRVREFLEGEAAPELPCPAESKPGLTYGHALCTSRKATEYELLVACDGDNLGQYSYKRGERFFEAYEHISERVRARGQDLIGELSR
ncbi:MAG: hypothetical protein ACRDNP_02805 [Gaiellaceae bacterium]